MVTSSFKYTLLSAGILVLAGVVELMPDAVLASIHEGFDVLGARRNSLSQEPRPDFYLGRVEPEFMYRVNGPTWSVHPTFEIRSLYRRGPCGPTISVLHPIDIGGKGVDTVDVYLDEDWLVEESGGVDVTIEAIRSELYDVELVPGEYTITRDCTDPDIRVNGVRVQNSDTSSSPRNGLYVNGQQVEDCQVFVSIYPDGHVEVTSIPDAKAIR